MRGENKQRIILDGVPGPWIAPIGMRRSHGFGARPTGVDLYLPGRWPEVFSLDFSADSKHFAYTEYVGKRRRKVINGVPGPLHEAVGIDFVFAPDGSDYAYLGFDAEGRVSIFRSKGKPLPVDRLLDGSLTFSPDGKHLAFVGERDGKMAAWLDGKPVPLDIPASRYGELCFSPDSERLAYRVKGTESSAYHWVVDGKAGPGSEKPVEGFRFSEDSAHFSHTVSLGEGKGIAVVVDAKIRATHALAAYPVFRSDGSLEYMASDGDPGVFHFRVTGF
jgi:WD40 repeat protein